MDDLEAVQRLRRDARLYPHSQRDTGTTDEMLRLAVADGCLLGGRLGGKLVAISALDLDEGRLFSACVAPEWQGLGLGRRLLSAVERIAVQFGMHRLGAWADLRSQSFFESCGYRGSADCPPHPDPLTGTETRYMTRRLTRRQTRYSRRIRRILADCGIPADYGRRHRLRLQEECRQLASVHVDDTGREFQLEPATARAWLDMVHEAVTEGVVLQPASAFRSVGYQVTIIQRKRQRGIAMEDILGVSAAPGYSEHHTGRAVDVNTPGCAPLEEEFEDTLAFEWLLGAAHRHGFRLSYPRGNRHGILYEPWHWYYTG